MKSEYKIKTGGGFVSAYGKVETYDRSLEVVASKLAKNKGSSHSDRAKFAQDVIATSKSLADSAIARRLRKPQKAIA
jgi:hypothetical protein